MYEIRYRVMKRSLYPQCVKEIVQLIRHPGGWNECDENTTFKITTQTAGILFITAKTRSMVLVDFGSHFYAVVDLRSDLRDRPAEPHMTRMAL